MGIQHGELVPAPRKGLTGSLKRFWKDKGAKKRDKAILIAAPIYVIWPVDALNDWALPLLGIADDAVLAVVAASIASKVWWTYRKAESVTTDDDRQV